MMLHKNATSTRQRTCTITKHILIFFTLYTCLALFVSHISYLDPSSIFFNPTLANKPNYSIDRTKQSSAYIKSAWLRSKTSALPASSNPKVCVGIPSTTHERARSLRTTIGSLLQGLDVQERNAIDLKVLMAHTDPLLHPAVHEPWLFHTVDEVLYYNETLSAKEIVRIVDLEKSAEFRGEDAVREKEALDYFHVLQRCEESGAEFIAMVKDDVLAMDGWLHRTLEALEEIEEESLLGQASRGEGEDDCKLTSSKKGQRTKLTF